MVEKVTQHNCPLCGESYKPRDFRWHFQAVHKIKPYSSEFMKKGNGGERLMMFCVCGRKFNTFSALDQHWHRELALCLAMGRLLGTI